MMKTTDFEEKIEEAISVLRFIIDSSVDSEEKEEAEESFEVLSEFAFDFIMSLNANDIHEIDFK